MDWDYEGWFSKESLGMTTGCIEQTLHNDE